MHCTERIATKRNVVGAFDALSPRRVSLSVFRGVTAMASRAAASCYLFIGAIILIFTLLSSETFSTSSYRKTLSSFPFLNDLLFCYAGADSHQLATASSSSSPLAAVGSDGPLITFCCARPAFAAGSFCCSRTPLLEEEEEEEGEAGRRRVLAGGVGVVATQNDQYASYEDALFSSNVASSSLASSFSKWLPVSFLGLRFASSSSPASLPIFSSFIITYAAAFTWGGAYSDCTRRSYDDSKTFCTSNAVMGRLASTFRTKAALSTATDSRCDSTVNWFWLGGEWSASKGSYIWNSDSASVTAAWGNAEPDLETSQAAVAYRVSQNILEDVYKTFTGNSNSQKAVPLCEVKMCAADDCVTAGTQTVNTAKRLSTNDCCVCKAKYTGDACGSCASGYFGTNCASEYCSKVGNNCNAQGTASYVAGNARPNCCTCKSNVDGDLCDVCATGMTPFPSCNKELCSKVGNNCNALGTATYTSTNTRPNCCTCKPTFTGTLCDQCATGYGVLPNCNKEYCSLAGNNCNTQGTASYVGGNFRPSDCCTCKANVDGDLCDACASGMTPFPSCNGELCWLQGNTCHMPGTSSYSSDSLRPGGCCTCRANFTGHLCNACLSGYTAMPTCADTFCWLQGNTCRAPGTVTYNPNNLRPGGGGGGSGAYGCCTCSPQYVGNACETRICHADYDCRGKAIGGTTDNSLRVGGVFPNCLCRCMDQYGGRNCRTLTETLTMTMSRTISVSTSLSQSLTASLSQTKTISASQSPPTATKSLSATSVATLTVSSSFSLSPSRSMSPPTASSSRSTTPSATVSPSTSVTMSVATGSGTETPFVSMTRMSESQSLSSSASTTISQSLSPTATASASPPSPSTSRTLTLTISALSPSASTSFTCPIETFADKKSLARTTRWDNDPLHRIAMIRPFMPLVFHSVTDIELRRKNSKELQQPVVAGGSGDDGNGNGNGIAPLPSSSPSTTTSSGSSGSEGGDSPPLIPRGGGLPTVNGNGNPTSVVDPRRHYSIVLRSDIQWKGGYLLNLSGYLELSRGPDVRWQPKGLRQRAGHRVVVDYDGDVGKLTAHIPLLEGFLVDEEEEAILYLNALELFGCGDAGLWLSAATFIIKPELDTIALIRNAANAVAQVASLLAGVNDLQALAMVGLMPCSGGLTSQLAASKASLSPFALGDRWVDVLLGNGLAILVALGASVVGVVGLSAHFRRARRLRWAQRGGGGCRSVADDDDEDEAFANLNDNNNTANANSSFMRFEEGLLGRFDSSSSGAAANNATAASSSSPLHCADDDAAAAGAGEGEGEAQGFADRTGLLAALSRLRLPSLLIKALLYLYAGTVTAVIGAVIEGVESAMGGVAVFDRLVEPTTDASVVPTFADGPAGIIILALLFLALIVVGLPVGMVLVSRYHVSRGFARFDYSESVVEPGWMDEPLLRQQEHQHHQPTKGAEEALAMDHRHHQRKQQSWGRHPSSSHPSSSPLWARLFLPRGTFYPKGTVAMFGPIASGTIHSPTTRCCLPPPPSSSAARQRLVANVDVDDDDPLGLGLATATVAVPSSLPSATVAAATAGRKPATLPHASNTATVVADDDEDPLGLFAPPPMSSSSIFTSTGTTTTASSSGRSNSHGSSSSSGGIVTSAPFLPPSSSFSVSSPSSFPFLRRTLRSVRHSLLWLTLPMWSCWVMAVGQLVLVRDVAVCRAVMGLLAVLHFAVAVMVLYVSPHIVRFSSVGASLGAILTGLVLIFSILLVADVADSDSADTAASTTSSYAAASFGDAEEDGSDSAVAAVRNGLQIVVVAQVILSVVRSSHAAVLAAWLFAAPRIVRRIAAALPRGRGQWSMEETTKTEEEGATPNPPTILTINSQGGAAAAAAAQQHHHRYHRNGNGKGPLAKSRSTLDDSLLLADGGDYDVSSGPSMERGGTAEREMLTLVEPPPAMLKNAFANIDNAPTITTSTNAATAGASSSITPPPPHLLSFLWGAAFPQEEVDAVGFHWCHDADAVYTTTNLNAAHGEEKAAAARHHQSEAEDGAAEEEDGDEEAMCSYSDEEAEDDEGIDSSLSVNRSPLSLSAAIVGRSSSQYHHSRPYTSGRHRKHHHRHPHGQYGLPACSRHRDAALWLASLPFDDYRPWCVAAGRFIVWLVFCCFTTVSAQPQTPPSVPISRKRRRRRKRCIDGTDLPLLTEELSATTTAAAAGTADAGEDEGEEMEAVADPTPTPAFRHSAISDERRYAHEGYIFRRAEELQRRHRADTIYDAKMVEEEDGLWVGRLGYSAWLAAPTASALVSHQQRGISRGGGSRPFLLESSPLHHHEEPLFLGLNGAHNHRDADDDAHTCKHEASGGGSSLLPLPPPAAAAAAAGGGGSGGVHTAVTARTAAAGGARGSPPHLLPLTVSHPRLTSVAGKGRGRARAPSSVEGDGMSFLF